MAKSISTVPAEKALDAVVRGEPAYVAPVTYQFFKTQQIGQVPKLDDGTEVVFTQRFNPTTNLWEDCGRFETEDAALAKKIRDYASANAWAHIYEITNN